MNRKPRSVPAFFLLVLLLSFVLIKANEVQAAPVFQAAGSVAADTSNVSPVWPPHQAGDIALLFIESRGEEPATLGTPAGFAPVPNSPQSTGTGNTGTRLTVYWARATSAAMAAPTVTDPGDHVVAQILTYRGVVETGNPWDVTGGGVQTPAATGIIVTGVTTTVPDTLVVVAVAHGIDGNSTARFSGWANTNLSSIVERVDLGRNNGDGGGFGIIDGVKATAGPTGNTTATLSNNFVQAFLTIALKPDTTPPTVTAITRVDPSPTSTLSVSWNVTFSEAVTGVNAADFSLVYGGGLSSGGIMSVTPSGANWVVQASTGFGTGTIGLNLVDDDTIVDAAGNPLGGSGSGNGNYTGQIYEITPAPCPPPSNVPSGVTVICQCDNFTRSSLNPSTIFGSNWVATTSDSTGILPRIVSNRLRLTENTGNNAKAATAPGIFPAADNYMSVEFLHYAYNGSGADGIAIILSDYSVPAQTGAFGGSLGYAQRSGVVGFAGGWIGVALDEFGNYQNPTEGRLGGPGFIGQSVGLRGSGSGMSGYRWLAGTPALSPGIDNRTSTTPSRGHRYQIVVDARNQVNGITAVSVNRDTTGSGSYTNLINVPNINAAAISAGFTQAPVPDNFQISFTGSTGGSTNIHEIAGLKICAQTMLPPTGGTLGGFNIIDEVYARGNLNALQGKIHTKLAGTSFKLKVAALNATSSAIESTYAISGNKTVTVELIDDSGTDPSCNSTTARCTSCTKPVVATQTMTFTSGDTGFKQSADFTVNGAYSRLLARARDGTATGCSVDVFTVRPTAFSTLSSSASNSALTGTPAFKAGTDTFTLSITANASNYAGVSATPKINAAAMQSTGTGWVVGSFTPATFPSASASVATGNFTYSEVGNFRFNGYAPATDATSARGIYDDTWTGVDQGAENGCVAGSYSNTKDANGKYGCLFGLTANSAVFGRFVPDHFALVSGAVGQFCNATTPFSYMGQPKLNLAYQLEARNGANGKTSNYSAALTPPYPVTAPVLVAEDQAASLQGCDLGSRITGLPTASWSAGTYTIPATDTTFSRPANPAALDASNCASTRANAGGPFWQLDIGVRITDADGAVITEPASDMNADTAATCVGSGCTARKIGGTGQVFGRLRLENAYGSEHLALVMPALLEYYDSGRWRINTHDDCTSLSDLSGPTAAIPVPSGSSTNSTTPRCNVAANTCSATSGVACNVANAIIDGSANLCLTAPGAVGYADISFSPASHLQFTGTPTAGRAGFGLYNSAGNARRIIYRREVR